MIKEIVKNLEKGRSLLVDISQEDYCNKSIAPYHSSIGGHMRHVLDMFNCVFIGFPSSKIDLTLRERNINAETIPSYCITYLENIVDHLKSLNETDLTRSVEVIDDLGGGKCSVTSTLGAVLAQAQSHAIHHYATIGYMMHHLGVVLEDNSFGVNPTTPKENMIVKN